MHDCQKLREDLTDLVLGGTPLDPAGSLAIELNSCDDCVQFHDDAVTVLKIVDSAEVALPELSEEYWTGFGARLRSELSSDRSHSPRSASVIRPRKSGFQAAMLVAAATVLIALTVLIFRTMHPLMDDSKIAQSRPQVEVIDDHIAGLDMATIDYLGQSELFLRSFVKIQPSDTEDLEDARLRAQLQLVVLGQRKEAAADFVPVEAVLDDYETVLRDINNMESDSSEDITDIQSRIERNGLIASMKAYQPRIVITTER